MADLRSLVIGVVLAVTAEQSGTGGQQQNRKTCMTTQPAPDPLFERIAQEHLRIETLVTRKRDGLDFHEVAVWSIEKALQAAFDAGKASA